MDTSDNIKYLGDYLVVDAPTDVLVVGAIDDALIAKSISTPLRFDDLSPAVQWAQEHNPANVVSTLVMATNSTNTELTHQLGRAIRAFSRRVVVNYRSSAIDSTYTDQVFFSLGFKKLQLADTNATPWYEYQLSQYKTAPDWLNARFWANPERFDIDEPFDDDYEDPDEHDDEND